MLEGVKRLNDNKAFTSVRLSSVMECYAGLLALSQMSGVLETKGINLITEYVNKFLALRNANTQQTLANVISYVAAYCEVAESTMANTILEAQKNTVIQKVKDKFQELTQRTFCGTLTVPPDSELRDNYIEGRNGVCQAYFSKFVDAVITKT